MSEAEIPIGGYVLATKYHDGDTGDQYAVGFFDGRIERYGLEYPRFNVVDSAGKNFRGNGFRRVEAITNEEGKWLVARFPLPLSEWVETGTPDDPDRHIEGSVWDWLAKCRAALEAERPSPMKEDPKALAEKTALERAARAAWDVLTDPATPGMNAPLTREQAAEARACAALAVRAALTAFLSITEEEMERLGDVIAFAHQEASMNDGAPADIARALLLELSKMAETP